MPPDAVTAAEIDRQLVLATQGGLPLVSRPYDELARQLGIAADEVQQRLAAMLADGRIRRIGAVPNHYAIGYTANVACNPKTGAVKEVALMLPPGLAPNTGQPALANWACRSRKFMPSVVQPGVLSLG